jgi:hypothetical protein
MAKGAALSAATALRTSESASWQAAAIATQKTKKASE